MSRDWVPFSAAALVTGAMALLLGAILLPATDGDAAATLMVVREQDGRWFTVAAMFFLAAVGTLLGLPSLLLLFPGRGRRTGLAALAVMTIASAGTAGFGMLLIFLRAMVLGDAVRVEQFDQVTTEVGLSGFLLGWVSCFYLGEALLALALLRARSTSRWIPIALLAHVALVPISRTLPDDVRHATVLLVVGAFTGLAIAANNEADTMTAPTAPLVSRQ